MQTPSTNPDEVRLLSYLSVRRYIGFLGISLPFILLIGACLANYPIPIQNSISHYYYTNMGTVFSGVLCAVAIFLFTYKGYSNDKKFLQILNDNSTTNVAAVCAILVALFPCDSIYTPKDMDLNTTQTTVNTIHYVSAIILFTFLGIMSFHFFRAGSITTKEEIIRHKIYEGCGISIWACLIIMGIFELLSLVLKTVIFERNKLIFESAALLAFGVSWLIKGQTFFKDKKISTLNANDK